MIKWIDTFLFNGEYIVKLRLKYLYQYVDKFYVVEQRYTYQGDYKNEYYVHKFKEWFLPYLDKIVFILDEKYVEGVTWDRETIHRNLAVEPIISENKNTEYIVTVCDVDEIPDVSIIHPNINSIYEMTHEKSLHLLQEMFYYNFKWFLNIVWKHAFIISNKGLEKNNSFQNMRLEENEYSIPCGWHFSSFMDKFDIQRKLKSFSHIELNDPYFTDLEDIQNSIVKGLDFAKRETLKIELRTEFQFPSEFLEFAKELECIQGVK